MQIQFGTMNHSKPLRFSGKPEAREASEKATEETPEEKGPSGYTPSELKEMGQKGRKRTALKTGLPADATWEEIINTRYRQRVQGGIQ